MIENKTINKALFKNTIINLIIFTSILLIFDLIIYNQVSNSLLKNVDEQLVMFDNTGRNNNRRDNRKEFPRDNERNVDEVDNISPRLIIIERNENGEIQNTEEIGSLSEYIEQISFDSSSIEKIYSIVIADRYFYRAINIQSIQNDTIQYLQILINVDGEMATIANIKNILILGTVILIIISLIASYILSKRSIKPIVDAYKLQTEFVQNASHELRTPLSIIQAKQELLLKSPNDKIIDKSNDISLTLKETKRLTKLIKELMDLARSDEGKVILNKEKLNIDNVIKEVIIPFEEMANLQGKNFITEFNIKSQITADKNKISELLVIILENALKYTSTNDSITIKTYQKDRKAFLEVSDTGIGVNDEDLKHIFERFYRADKARSKETGGTGLGLSIAKTIVEMHDGTIKAEHNNPKGLKIIVQLKIN